MGLELRDHVHEIEFLSVVAFVAREIQMALPSKSPYTRFTPQDLDMAYAFQMKYGETKCVVVLWTSYCVSDIMLLFMEAVAPISP